MSSDSCCCEWPCVQDESWRQFFRVSRNTNGGEVIRQMYASSMGSVVTTLLLHPLTVIKVRLQNRIEHATISTIIQDAIQEKRGFRTLWSGTSSGLMLTVPNTVSYMVAYERCKLSIGEIMPVSLSLFTPAISGAISRAIAVSIVAPLELARTLQSSGINKKVSTILREIISMHGYRGIFRGWTTTILRDCPYSAIYWFFLETTRPWIDRTITGRKDKNTHKLHPMSSFFAGASSGLLAAFCTHPFDVIKTRRQLSVIDARPFQSFKDILNLYKLNGPRELFRGLSMRLLTVIPASAIMITIYEYCK